MEIDLDSDMVLTNKGGVPRTDHFPDQQLDLKQQLAKHMLPVGSHESPISDELKLRLEENTIPNNEIDPSVLSIKNDIVQYFKKQAELEELIGPEDNFDLKIVFVKPEFFGEEKETKGNYFPLERLIVISYSGINDEIGLFKIATIMFHESRHAVSRQAGVIHLNPDVDPQSPGELPYDTVEVLVGMDRATMSSDFDLLEEIYATGYTAIKVGEIENADFQESMKMSLQQIETQHLNPKLITSYKKLADDSGGFEESGNTQILELFYLLTEKIPNLLELISKVRSGMTNAKRNLAQAIVSQYDKEALALLIRGGSDVASLVKIILENK